MGTGALILSMRLVSRGDITSTRSCFLLLSDGPRTDSNVVILTVIRRTTVLGIFAGERTSRTQTIENDTALTPQVNETAARD